MSHKKEIEFKGRVQQHQALTYLESLCEALRGGAIYVQDGTGFVALEPTETLDLEVSASRKHEKERFKLELSWGKDKPLVEDVGLRISSSKPETPEASAPAGET